MIAAREYLWGTEAARDGGSRAESEVYVCR